MKVGSATFVFINLFILIVTAAGVLGIIWWFLNSGDVANDTKIKADFARMEASSQIYFNRLGFYTGVCEDIRASKNYSCSESSGAFAVEAEYGLNSYLCLDSTGFSGQVSASKGGRLHCVK